MQLKIKLSSIDLIELVNFLDQMELPENNFGILVSNITLPTLLYKELAELMRDKIDQSDIKKIRTLKIPESYALCFIMSFGGVDNTQLTPSYRNVAKRNFNKQLEEQLFQYGRFKAPQNQSITTLIEPNYEY